MKELLVIYDDSRRPDPEICSITGRKSYGNIIFKRQSLKQRARERLAGLDGVYAFIGTDDTDDMDGHASLKDMPVFKMYSDHEAVDIPAVGILFEKALYIKENYSIECSGRIAAVMYPSYTAYTEQKDKQQEEDYERIVSEAFVSLADANNFRTFITSGFDARFFNALSGDEYTVVKSSDNVDKLRREYKYFTLLPPAMKQWYGTVFDYKEEGNRASYSIERYHMTDLALRYVHGAIGEDEFRDICRVLFHFISIRQVKQVTDEEYDNNASSLYIDKVDERIRQLKDLGGYERIRDYIATGTEYEDIDDIIARYKKLYQRITQGRSFKKILTVAHGDLCFSNILYNHDVSLLKLIDPKGAETEDELYMNPYYDIAKLSHSICGSYDYFNSDQYEISMDNDMKLRLTVDSDNDRYIKIFREYLINNSIDPVLIRLYETSLFLSMLPLHMDREKKVLGFILNAVSIMDELEQNT